MLKLIIRDWQHGRLQSDISCHLIADIFVNKDLQFREVSAAQAQPTLVCIHWDNWEGSSVTSVTLTHRREEKEDKFGRIICESLLKKISCLRSFLFDAYRYLDTKLVEVKIRPITFVFVNVKNDPFVQNRQRMLKLFKELISNYLSPLPDIVVKHKVLEKCREPCRGLAHVDKGDENQCELQRLSNTKTVGCDQWPHGISASETFDFMHKKIEIQNEYLEREFALLQKQTDDITNMLSLALDLVAGKCSWDIVPKMLNQSRSCRNHEVVSINSSHCSQGLNVEASGRQLQGNIHGATTLGDSDDKKTSLSENTSTTGVVGRQEIMTNSQQTVTHSESTNSCAGTSQGAEQCQQGPKMDARHDDERRLNHKTSAAHTESPTSGQSLSSQRTSTHLFPKSRSYEKRGANVMTLDDIKNEETGTRFNISAGHVLGTKDDSPTLKPRTHHQGLRTLAEIKEEEWRKSKQKEEEERGKFAGLLSRMRFESMVASDTLSKLLTRRGRPESHGNFLDVIRLSSSDDSGFVDAMTQLYKSALMTNDNSETLPVTKEGMNTVFCIDTSSSITKLHLQHMKEIIKHFLSEIEEIAGEHDIEENIGLIVFGGRARILHHLTNDYGQLRDIIETLDGGGSSPLIDSIAVAFACLEKGGICRFGEVFVPPRIIFITDGMPTMKDREMTSDAVTPSDQTKQQFVKNLEKCQPKLTLAGRNIWIPTGNADRSFIKSVTKMCDGELVEGEDVRSLARHQRIMRAVGSVLQVVKTEQLTMENIDTIFDNAMEMVAPDLSMEEKTEVRGAVLKHTAEGEENSDTENFDNVVQIGGFPPLGSRVRRGPDWQWNDQDNHGPGTVFNHDKEDKGWIWVRWDCGRSNQYRYGQDNAYDILISEDKPPAVYGQTIEIGVLVERGPHWPDSHENQDGGQGNDGVVIRKRGQRVMVRWKANESIHQYSFGENDRYEVSIRNQDFQDMTATAVSKKAEKKETVKCDEPTSNQQETTTRPYIWQRLNDKNRWEDFSEAENAMLKKEYEKGLDGVCLLVRDGKSYQISFRMQTERSLADNSLRKIRKLSSDM